MTPGKVGTPEVAPALGRDERPSGAHRTPGSECLSPFTSGQFSSSSLTKGDGLTGSATRYTPFLALVRAT